MCTHALPTPLSPSLVDEDVQLAKLLLHPRYHVPAGGGEGQESAAQPGLLGRRGWPVEVLAFVDAHPCQRAITLQLPRLSPVAQLPPAPDLLWVQQVGGGGAHLSAVLRGHRIRFLPQRRLCLQPVHHCGGPPCSQLLQDSHADARAAACRPAHATQIYRVHKVLRVLHQQLADARAAGGGREAPVAAWPARHPRFHGTPCQLHECRKAQEG